MAATLDVRHARYVGLQVGVTGLPTQNSEGPVYGERQVGLKKQKPMTSVVDVPWAVPTQLRHTDQRMPNAIVQRTVR